MIEAGGNIDAFLIEFISVGFYSGIFKPGMNAILGPTGGGKTSLVFIHFV